MTTDKTDPPMTTARAIKSAGLKNMNTVCELTDCTPQTLDNWHKNKQKLFAIVIEGCKVAISKQK